MIKKKRAVKERNKQIQKPEKEMQTAKNNMLIFGGVIVAMSSIALLIYVLSEKVFHLS